MLWQSDCNWLRKSNGCLLLSTSLMFKGFRVRFRTFPVKKWYEHNLMWQNCVISYFIIYLKTLCQMQMLYSVD